MPPKRIQLRSATEAEDHNDQFEDSGARNLEERDHDSANSLAATEIEGNLDDLQDQPRPTTPALSETPQAVVSLESTLAALLSKIADSSSAKGTHVRAPDKFSGVDRSKYRIFVAQCLLVFRSSPHKFDTDAKKVNYACSYLDGIAFMWYENHLVSDTEPDWFYDWNLFKSVLKEHFGEVNATHAAEHKIRSLSMKGNDTLINYITKFHTYSNVLNWNQGALTAEFRRGLSSRIKDDLAKVDYDDYDLAKLKQAVIKIDARLTERQEERHYESGSAPTSGRNSSRTSASRSDTRSETRSAAPARQAIVGYRPQGTPSATPLPLDRSGKVTPEEKKRRADLDLCSYCGDKHKVDACPKRPRTNLRAARATFSVQGFP
ncbi:hypothetical protein MNV49_004025 [Pseudohyphozyma bogoriensis]|nr:hypothetical protein MNV49_004025 [Pseudohyphozyma bogoriensis]